MARGSIYLKNRPDRRDERMRNENRNLRERGGGFTEQRVSCVTAGARLLDRPSGNDL
jgi:hypothetical protein